MGTLNCCCASMFEVDELDGDEVDMNKKIRGTPNNSNQPMLHIKSMEESTEQHANEKQHSYQISLSVMCDENTTEICLITDRLIDVLSVYHKFVVHYNAENKTKSIWDLIGDEFSEYTLIKLRSDYHHLQTYHGMNAEYMQKVRDKVSIDVNLDEINEKIQKDEEQQSYFGHTMDGEIAMIRCLNEVHRYCVNPQNANSDDPEISDDASEDSKEYNLSDESDKNKEENEENDQVNDDDNDTSQNVKKTKKKRRKKKKGYTKSKTKDIDDQKDENNEETNEKNIDVRYEKHQKKKTKVAKLKKPKRKYTNEKKKRKVGKLKNDESWLKQSKPTHTVSKSIQMLSGRSLVSTKSLKFIADDDEHYDLSTMDLNVDMAELNAHDHQERASIAKGKSTPSVKKRSSMFDADYDVDVDADDDDEQ